MHAARACVAITDDGTVLHRAGHCLGKPPRAPVGPAGVLCLPPARAVQPMPLFTVGSSGTSRLVRTLCWSLLAVVVAVAVVLSFASDLRSAHGGRPHLERSAEVEQRHDVERVVPGLAARTNRAPAVHTATPLLGEGNARPTRVADPIAAFEHGAGPVNASTTLQSEAEVDPPVAENITSAEPAQRSGHPAIAFLVLTIDGSVAQPGVWKEFFANASDDVFNVYIHRSDNGTDVSPSAAAFVAACRGRVTVAPYAAGTAWGQLINASRMLALAALDNPSNVAFTYVSATTVPVKGFSVVYDALVSRGDSSSFCVTGPKAWERSKLNASLVYPKHAQWFTLGKTAARDFVNTSRGDPVGEVDTMCGGSWHQCYPTTSEELQMGAIVGTVPAHAMGSAWLESHPPAGGGFDTDRAVAVVAENAAGEEFVGGPVHTLLPWPGVNGGHLSVRDVGQKNYGVCDTMHWWDDYPNDAAREPAFEPFQLLADVYGVSEPGEVEALLEQHVDRFWTPLWHPQVFGPQAMTEQFLLQGLCASRFLFARKIGPDFSLRLEPFARDMSGEDIWTCPAEAPWRTQPREKLGPRACGGMRPAPILGLGAQECKQLCCAQGPDICSAWQYRGHRSKLDFCWLGHATGCKMSTDMGSSLWHGERLAGVNITASNESQASQQAVLAAFRKCFGSSSDAGAAAQQAGAGDAAPVEHGGVESGGPQDAQGLGDVTTIEPPGEEVEDEQLQEEKADGDEQAEEATDDEMGDEAALP